MKIYIDGLERSGNVFLSYAIGMTTGIEVVSIRNHKIEALQNYKEEYPFIVPVRDALPSIASAKIYRDKVFEQTLFGVVETTTKELGYIIKQYSEYVKYLIANPRFFIAPFNEFTKDHNKVIYMISKMYPEIKIIKNVTYDEIVDITTKQKTDAFDVELGNLPRATPKKTEIEETIKSTYQKEINEIQANIDVLYQRYYKISDINDIWYNKYMSDIIKNEEVAPRCCAECTCEDSHSSKRPEE
jgi:hypothetical protein